MEKVYSWQMYDEQGVALEDNAPKFSAVLQGLLHGSAHVWLWRRRGSVVEVLIQKRARGKLNWPGMLDKSVGGHMGFGEEPLATAVRKAQQELGIELPLETTMLHSVHRWYMPIESTDLVENEFQWVYITGITSALRITHDPKEVQTTEWLDVAELKKIAMQKETASVFVPYGHLYYLSLYEAITRVARLA